MFARSSARTRFFFLAASVSSLFAAAIAQGCGNTEETATPAGDAGSDVVVDAKKDVVVVGETDSATCDLGHQFTNDIPDADIADGASTTGICVGCAKKHCQKWIDECNANCQCQDLAGQALECYAKTGNVVGCAGQFASSSISKETQSTGFGLFSCLNDSCKEECQTDQFNDAGSEAGPTDAGDGG